MFYFHLFFISLHFSLISLWFLCIFFSFSFILFSLSGIFLSFPSVSVSLSFHFHFLTLFFIFFHLHFMSFSCRFLVTLLSFAFISSHFSFYILKGGGVVGQLKTKFASRPFLLLFVRKYACRVMKQIENIIKMHCCISQEIFSTAPIWNFR